MQATVETRHHVRWIIHKIQKDIELNHYDDKNPTVVYALPDVSNQPNDGRVPNHLDQVKLVRRLAKENYLEIIDRSSDPNVFAVGEPVTEFRGFEIKTSQTQLDKAYVEYDCEQLETNPDQVVLTLNLDYHPCLQQNKTCYKFRYRRKLTKRLKMLEVLIENQGKPLSAAEIATATQSKPKTVSQEIPAMFLKIAEELGLQPKQLYEGGNGYRLVCHIEKIT